jgi:hypothetical protein
MPIETNFGDASGSFGHATVRIEEPWPRESTLPARILFTANPELGESGKGMTPRQARALAALLSAAADECDRSDRVRERGR